MGLNVLGRFSAPQKQGKNKSLSRPRPDRSEIDLLRNYHARVIRLGVDSKQIEALDLDNDFYWLFRLSGLLATAYQTFDSINEKHFDSKLPRPKIIYCNRSTGGYYNRTRHTIGISFAMTVEFGEPEFFETLLHEIAHILVQSHGPKFYEVLIRLGGTGKKAPLTMLLEAKRKKHLEEYYPVIVHCPQCLRERRYRTKRALKYACRTCCTKFAGGKYDERFRFVLTGTRTSDL